MAKKGRPNKSIVRQNIVNVLFYVGKAYGYKIYKRYIEIFPKVSQRLIYYHLRKGVLIGEFKVEKVERKKGDYSWGQEAERVYYKLGPNAKPRESRRLEKVFR